MLDNEPDIEIVGTAEDGKSAIVEVDRRVPDVILIDLSMPRTDVAQPGHLSGFSQGQSRRRYCVAQAFKPGQPAAARWT